MVKYSVEQHVKNLKKMLKEENPCNLCPSNLDMLNPHYEAVICKVCHDFIGLRVFPSSKINHADCRVFPCPCVRLGEEEAIKRTLIAIEEYDANSKV